MEGLQEVLNCLPTDVKVLIPEKVQVGSQATNKSSAFAAISKGSFNNK